MMFHATLAAQIEQAAQQLEAGELVAFPTETVYGLGADAENPEAVAKIYATKGRPQDHPVIVHISPEADLSYWASPIPDAAYALIKAFWPGPLTLILQRHPLRPDAVSKGGRTIGIRCPNHPVAQHLLRTFKQGKGGIAAPSANRFGRISPTTAQHVYDEFGSSVSMILDGGPCALGIESTIVDLSQGIPILLRPGHITQAALANCLGQPVFSKSDLQINNQAVVPHSGGLAAHYAPLTPMMVCDKQGLLGQMETLHQQQKKVGILLRHHADIAAAKLLVLADEPQQYAHDFYAALRELDAAGLDLIMVEALPVTDMWQGVADRLGRAVVGSGRQ